LDSHRQEKIIGIHICFESDQFVYIICIWVGHLCLGAHFPKEMKTLVQYTDDTVAVT